MSSAVVVWKLWQDGTADGLVVHPARFNDAGELESGHVNHGNWSFKIIGNDMVIENGHRISRDTFKVLVVPPEQLADIGDYTAMMKWAGSQLVESPPAPGM